MLARDINEKSLYRACKAGDLEAIKRLINGDKVSITKALTKAVSGEHLDCVKFLLQSSIYPLHITLHYRTIVRRLVFSSKNTELLDLIIDNVPCDIKVDICNYVANLCCTLANFELLKKVYSYGYFNDKNKCELIGTLLLSYPIQGNSKEKVDEIYKWMLSNNFLLYNEKSIHYIVGYNLNKDYFKLRLDILFENAKTDEEKAQIREKFMTHSTILHLYYNFKVDMVDILIEYGFDPNTILEQIKGDWRYNALSEHVKSSYENH